MDETNIKQKKSAVNLVTACDDLFNNWKKSQKMKKQVSSDEIKQLLEQAEEIPGTKIKVIIGKSVSDGAERR